MKDKILVLDGGTTYVKAYIFDMKIQCLAEARHEIKTEAPRDGWVEQEPWSYFGHAVQACRDAVRQAEISWEDVACLSITNQRCTTVVWDRETGKPLRNAVTWQDARTAGLHKEFYSNPEMEAYIKRVGRRGALTPAFVMAWIKENEAHIWGRLSKGEAFLGTVEAYLLYLLTGGKQYATSFSNAGMYACYDCVNLDWDWNLLKRMGLYSEALKLPQVVDDAGFLGLTAEGIFPVEVPITSMIADQQASMFANDIRGKGICKCTLSTGIFAGVNIGREFRQAPEGLINVPGWKLGDEICFMFEGQGGSAGSVQQWAKDELGLFQSYEEAAELAASVPDSGGVIFVPALSGLPSPYWDMSARGSFLGLSRTTNKAHLVRAMLEGVAFRVKDILSCVKEQANLEIELVRVSGGMTKNTCLLGILADTLGVPVEKTLQEDPTLAGAALLGAYGAGLFERSLPEQGNSGKQILPATTEAERKKRYEYWSQAVERVLNWPGQHENA